MDYSLPGFSVHGILQARILGWVVFPFSRGSSQPRDQTQVSLIAGEFLTTRPPEKPLAVILICISLMISDIEHLFMYLAFLIAQLVKNPHAVQETPV